MTILVGKELARRFATITTRLDLVEDISELNRKQIGKTIATLAYKKKFLAKTNHLQWI